MVSFKVSLGFQFRVSVWGFNRVSFRTSFKLSLGFHSRVSYQDFFSRFLNVQVGSFRVPLGFHLGCHSGFL